MIRKLFVFSVTTVFLYLTYGLFINRYELNIIKEQITTQRSSKFFDYKGVLNVHSNLSSGSGSVKDIIKAAQISELDFIFFTDLNNFDPEKNIEGYHEKLFVFVDGEYSYLDSRLLNLGIKDKGHLLGRGQSQIMFTDLLSKKELEQKHGFFILAHPKKSGFEWQGQLPLGLDGIEVVNLKEVWRNAWKNETASFLWTLLIYPFNPELSFIRLFKEPTDVIDYWDELINQRPLVGIAGADAEAKAKTPFGDLIRFPSYSVLFNIVRNHILLRSELTGNKEKDSQKILGAIKNGQFYWSLDIMADPKGFYATVESSSTKKSYLFGEQIPWSDDLRIKVHLPQKPKVPFEVILYKDGETFAISNSQDSIYQLFSPGTYRIVVRVIPTFPLPDGKKWVPWIYTNPFYIAPSSNPKTM